MLKIDSHEGPECGFSSTSVQDLTKQQASHKSKKNLLNVICVKMHLARHATAGPTDGTFSTNE